MKISYRDNINDSKTFSLNCSLLFLGLNVLFEEKVHIFGLIRSDLIVLVFSFGTGHSRVRGECDTLTFSHRRPLAPCSFASLLDQIVLSTENVVDVVLHFASFLLLHCY